MTVSELITHLSGVDPNLRVAVGGRDGKHFATIVRTPICTISSVDGNPWEEYYPEFHDGTENGPLETIVEIV